MIMGRSYGVAFGIADELGAFTRITKKTTAAFAKLALLGALVDGFYGLKEEFKARRGAGRWCICRPRLVLPLGVSPLWWVEATKKPPLTGRLARVKIKSS